jgi:hypothetical protein
MGEADASPLTRELMTIMPDEEWIRRMRAGKERGDQLAVRRAELLELRLYETIRKLDALIHEHQAEMPPHVVGKLRDLQKGLQTPVERSGDL